MGAATNIAACAAPSGQYLSHQAGTARLATESTYPFEPLASSPSNSTDRRRLRAAPFAAGWQVSRAAEPTSSSPGSAASSRPPLLQPAGRATPYEQPHSRSSDHLQPTAQSVCVASSVTPLSQQPGRRCTQTSSSKPAATPIISCTSGNLGIAEAPAPCDPQPVARSCSTPASEIGEVQ